eukprot:743140-Prorocentrum_minimum.AAC.1
MFIFENVLCTDGQSYSYRVDGRSNSRPLPLSPCEAIRPLEKSTLPRNIPKIFPKYSRRRKGA